MSWYQTRPATSLTLIETSGAGIIDVGEGASGLVDFLLDTGFNKLAVLDLSVLTLEHAQRRLGRRASSADWCEADVTMFNPPRPLGL